MTNIFIQDIFYLTLDEARNSSKIFKNLTDEEVKIYVSKAENIVNDIIGRDFKNNTPLKIKQATLLISECVYENKDKKNGRIIKSETRRGNQVVFATENEDFSLKKLHPCMNKEIYLLLKDFIKDNLKVGATFFRT